MITESSIYWITRMSHFHKGVLTFGVVGLIVFIAAFLLSASLETGKFSVKFAIGALVFGFIAFSSSFIPNTKEMCAIKVIPVIANNENVKDMPDKVLELADEWINELRPHSKDKK